MKKILICFYIGHVLVAFGCRSEKNQSEVMGENVAKDAAETMGTEESGIQRTKHPEAQWFPDGSFGLFMHWGIHSVAGIQPSWAMIKGYPHGGNPDFHPPEKYFALAEQFNPQRYDPDKWMAAAKAAGMQYVVLTTKHHDGYTLWPSEHGQYTTTNYMNGRDLLKPYVEACRKHGLKVGFYFSPRDWSYPGYPVADVDFDHAKRSQFLAITDSVENQQAFDAFYAYTRGQLEELLTNYGEIDVLWFDGINWPGVDNLKSAETIRWIRELQPGILINDRWGGKGDFETVEWRFAEEQPEDKWWEYCISWKGHWGYDPEAEFRDVAWVLEMLAKARAWGGNFLLNIGPAPDGTMPDGYYARLDSIADWMEHSSISVIEAHPLPNPAAASVPATRQGETWYLHCIGEDSATASISGVENPQKVWLLRTGETVPFEYEGETLSIYLSEKMRTPLDNVVGITW